MGRPKKYAKKTLAKAVDRYFASITRTVTMTELIETGERDDKGSEGPRQPGRKPDRWRKVCR